MVATEIQSLIQEKLGMRVVDENISLSGYVSKITTYIPTRRNVAIQRGVIQIRVKNIIEKFSESVVYHRSCSVGFNTKGQNYCDEKNYITLDLSKTRKNYSLWFDNVLAIGYHEFCHFWTTPFSKYKNYFNDTSKNKKILHRIVNLLEDVRIEKKFQESFPDEYVLVDLSRVLQGIDSDMEKALNLKDNTARKLNLLHTVFYGLENSVEEFAQEKDTQFLEDCEPILNRFVDDMSVDNLITTAEELYDLVHTTDEIDLMDILIEDFIEKYLKGLLEGESSDEFKTIMKSASDAESTTKEEVGDAECNKVEIKLSDVRSHISSDDYVTNYRGIAAKNRHIINDMIRSFKVSSRDQRFSDRGRTSGRLDTSKFVDIVSGSKSVYMSQEHVKSNNFFIGILIDLSGSMGGQKIRKARETAVCLVEALSKISNCKTFVYGHSTGNSYTAEADWKNTHCQIYDFNGKKETVASIIDIAENYDGMAIKRVSDEIRSKTQDNGILFVISDGMPAGTNYYGNPAIKHTKRMVQYSKTKNNIPCIQIAIDSVDSAKMFEEFITLQDLATLPKQLSKIVTSKAKELMKT